MDVIFTAQTAPSPRSSFTRSTGSDPRCAFAGQVKAQNCLDALRRHVRSADRHSQSVRRAGTLTSQHALGSMVPGESISEGPGAVCHS